MRLQGTNADIAEIIDSSGSMYFQRCFQEAADKVQEAIR